MIAGIAMVKDEVDIIEPVLRHMVAEGCDELLVADNMSTDGTRDLLCSLVGALPLSVVDDREVGYFQSLKMTRLAHEAGRAGASWVVPFDADEVWYSPDGSTVAEVLTDAWAQVVAATGFDHVATGEDPPGRHPVARMVHRRSVPQKFPKVAFRYSDRVVLHMGNHDVDGWSTRQSGLELRHFQYRSLEQMTRKLRNGKVAFDATNIHPGHGTHWREGGALSDDELAERWATLQAEEGLIVDPAPLRG